jgi:hypothetical protein
MRLRAGNQREDGLFGGRDSPRSANGSYGSTIAVNFDAGDVQAEG